MVKESSLALKICDWMAKYSIYIAIFLMPIFFLPWTTDVLDFNKQALLLLLVFVSLFASLIKILVSGKFEVKKNPMNIVAGVLFLIYLLATVFSSYRYGSFWGMPLQASESLLTLSCLLIFYFLVSNVLSKKDIFISTIILSFSAIIAEIVGVLQLFGLFIIPFDFAKTAAFNTFGSVGSLGFLTAALFPLATVLLILVKKWWRALFVAQIILSALILILVNYPIIWWVVIIGSALTLILGIMKSDLFNGRWMALPMFFLAIALFFVLLNLQISWLPHNANEILLSQKTGFDIGMQTLKTKPIFGSGPGTFAYDFSKFKDPNFSKSSLWNITFNKSSSEVLNTLTTMGVLGFLALLTFMIFPIFYGIKSLVAKKDVLIKDKENQIYSILLMGLFVALIELSIAYFLYNGNMAMNFVLFFLIASIIGLVFESKKKYMLKPSSFITLAATLVFTLVFIFGVGLLILDGQRYAAEINYYEGLAAYQAKNQAAGLQKLEAAASLNPDSDLYFRQLSQAYLLGLQDELKNTQTTPTDEQKTRIQTLISNSINAGKIATDINPQDVSNWSSRGFVYQSLLGVSNDASTLAISSYDSALKLDPNNPYLYAQEGNVYLAEVIQSLDQSDKSDLLSKAQTQLEKATSLNKDYLDALYSLGIVYSLLGQNDKAISVFTTVQQLNPKNTNIPKILDNLKSGKPIVQVATPPAATPPGGEVTNPTSSVKTP